MRFSFLLALSLVAALQAADVKKEQPMTPGGVYRANDMQRPRPLVITPPGFSTQEKAGAAPSDSDKIGTQAPTKSATPAPSKTKQVATKSPTSPAPAAKARIIRLKTMTAQMKYDQAEFTVRPGEPVRLIFENGDDLPHNIVFCQPGTDTATMALKQMEDPVAALKRHWVPDDKSIWLYSKMLNPHETDTLAFNAPEKPGDYPFVCTFPGHALTMNGKMKVLPLGKGLQDLKFALYLGSWNKLPDFSKLTPHRQGVIGDNRVQIKLDDYKNEFGVVFTGKLNAPRKGSYRFYIAGDDGVRLKIDGKTVVEHDGIHPAEIKEASTQLEAGPHDFRLEYFQAQGHIAVFAAWKGANFDVTPLSTWRPKGWEKGAKAKKTNAFDPIPLVVKEEPVVYRNFIAGAGNRSIAVGYPGGVSLAWSAEQMNLALIWRGAFIDASKHWNSRGGGHQPPLGYDVLSPAFGQPFAILPSPDSPWPATEERAPGYVWKGYRLDDQRYPTFMYEWKGLKVEDRSVAAPDKLIRKLKLHGTVPKNTFLRLATGKIEAVDGSFWVQADQLKLERQNFENKLRITAPGARIVGDNLLLPVAGNEITVTYSWPQ